MDPTTPFFIHFAVTGVIKGQTSPKVDLQKSIFDFTNYLNHSENDFHLKIQLGHSPYIV